MRTTQAARGARKRKLRPRPIPRWLRQSNELEATARSRCLLVLSVLSGEKPVTAAIAAAKISRGTYYQLETRALEAMLTALNPLASSGSSPATALASASGQIAQLKAQVERLEQEKRRTQRLLLLTRKAIRAPVKTTHRGRWSKQEAAPKRSPRSTRSASPSAAPSSTPPGAPSS